MPQFETTKRLRLDVVFSHLSLAYGLVVQYMKQKYGYELQTCEAGIS